MHLSGKTSKKGWVELMRLCGEANNWDLAQQAGAKARELDPSDGDLDTELKDLAAARHDRRRIHRGCRNRRWFPQDDQRRRQAKGTRRRKLLRAELRPRPPRLNARQAYEANPADTNAVAKLLQLLRRVGDFDALNEAKRVALAAFKTTSEYRFRMFAGDLEIKAAEQRVEERRKAAEGDPDNEQLALQLEEADGASKSSNSPNTRNGSRSTPPIGSAV